MSESLLTGDRLFPLLFALGFILFPLVFAGLIPNRATQESDRLKVRGKLTALVLATALALVIWGGLAFAGTRHPWAATAANFSWLMFFPLWFGFAMPMLGAKNPAWAITMHGSAESSGTVRTASLVNRERQNPVVRWMWVAAAIACAAGPIAIALRGLELFPMDPASGAASISESPEHLAWLVLLLVSMTAPLNLLWLPRVLRAILMEAEPMDVAGSSELSELYARQRRRRVLGMFWLTGIAVPASLGAIFALVVWFPSLGSMWGLIGGLGGALLGCFGAAFGFMMTAERAKIAEVRGQLNAALRGAGNTEA